MVFRTEIAPRNAQFGQLEHPLHPSLTRLVDDQPLWTHQAEAINALRNGISVVIATGTGSGKSRCFQIPIAESIVGGIRAGSSLLIYPTKALAHDQLRALNELAVPGLKAATYDADASRKDRAWARENANVILTNPEMAHHGILANHHRWNRFLSRLDYVVVDELHTMRGAFGTNMAHLLRRLRRCCPSKELTFAFTSATIGTPSQLAEELCGAEVVEVTNDGSPRGSRTLVLMDPAEQGHDSPVGATAEAVADAVLDGRRAVAFCTSRNQTERVANAIRARLPPEFAAAVQPYRSGYLADERREIEELLANGTLRAVVATSALELGVDIGGLDTAVLCGFPGTVASMWQQVGRAGRAGAASMGIVVAGSNQLDQWWLRHPAELFKRPPEKAVINLTNPALADPQLACAAFEAPLQPSDRRLWGDLDETVRRGVLADRLGIRPGRYGIPRAVWRGKGVPHSTVSFRSAGGGTVRIADQDGHDVGTVERHRAPALAHPGAVYLHRGTAWRVVDLDLGARLATVEPTDSATYTRPRSRTEIDIIGTNAKRDVGRSELRHGTVVVTEKVTSYEEVTAGGREVVARHDLDLPPQELITTAVWYTWSPQFCEAAGIAPGRLPGALHALEHAAIGILPLFAICDRSDVGGMSSAHGPDSGWPTVVIHDGLPGGSGVASLAYDNADRHLSATLESIQSCRCRRGCPGCVQSPKCGNGNEPLDKHAAVALLTMTLGDDAEPF